VDAANLKQLILDNVEKKQWLMGVVASGGRLDVYKAMIGCFDWAMRKWAWANDRRFQYSLSGSFQLYQRGWAADPAWTYCSEDWNFPNSSLPGGKPVTLYLATYKANPSLRYVGFSDPDNYYKWSGWKQVP
jgi:hypothetical protein